MAQRHWTLRYQPYDSTQHVSVESFPSIAAAAVAITKREGGDGEFRQLRLIAQVTPDSRDEDVHSYYEFRGRDVRYTIVRTDGPNPIV